MSQPATHPSFRDLPATDRVLRSAAVGHLLDDYAHAPVVYLVRQVLDECRAAVAAGSPAPDVDTVAEAVVERARAEWSPSLRPLINATGVILHTNLGRAPLSTEAIAAMQDAAAYSDLELDLSVGQRGSRHAHAAPQLQALTGAESALVTVNNAAAVLLALAALARGKEVIVSRGQAVEIGGGFRVPVILRQSGARLVEVGTTNRTRLDDYRQATSPRTGAILHVHSSNFRIIGFTEEVPLADLAGLAHERGLPLIDDNGSGAFLDTTAFGLAHEPMPVESLQAGSDVVAFSGDKLLGGPQAGIILGRADLLARLARYPLLRALRPDKIALAALSATLRSYLRGDAIETIPVWRMIAAAATEIARRAEDWRERAVARGLPVELQAGESAVGGGSLPGETLPTTLLVLPPRLTAGALRSTTPSVIGRTQGDRVLLDLRTVPPDQDTVLLQVVCDAARVDGAKRAVIDSGAR